MMSRWPEEPSSPQNGSQPFPKRERGAAGRGTDTARTGAFRFWIAKKEDAFLVLKNKTRHRGPAEGSRSIGQEQGQAGGLTVPGEAPCWPAWKKCIPQLPRICQFLKVSTGFLVYLISDYYFKCVWFHDKSLKNTLFFQQSGASFSRAVFLLILWRWPLFFLNIMSRRMERSSFYFTILQSVKPITIDTTKI